ncbi:unnamed protein product [Parnassius mnemosyne]|uniref:Uncharacterized protein n=1 Tax=Parnassius mnemosyne TaxID=213953 RepID=A0AAV1LRB1_9NEOP
MDDLMTGCQSIEEGIVVYKEMKDLMRMGGFQLQKWGSSSQELLEKIGENKGNKNQKKRVDIGVEKEVKEVTKVLGLNWNSELDNFEYLVKLPAVSTPLTKRKVVADIARLFDPLGWISPVIISAKVIIQKLWMSGIEWDQELPDKLLQEWIAYRGSLIDLSGFTIPRWIYTRDNNERVELHGFSDASCHAYAAVVYLRVINNTGEIYTSLITSKTKVAPIIQRSIPLNCVEQNC